MLLNPNLREFWTAPDIRYRILYGGRSSSKTYDAAGMAVFMASQIKIRFLCLRQFQNKISESVYETLKDRIYAFNMQDQFDIQKTTIIHLETGSEFIFMGIARNIKEIKGLQGIDITWIEEAEDVTKDQMKIIEPTIMRKSGSQLWLIFNPRYVGDYVWQKYVLNPPKRSIVHQINYDENPFLELDMLETIQEEKELDIDDYSHIYLGVPKGDNEESLIKRSWILASIDAHEKLGIDLTGGAIVGYDVADDGKDANALTVMTGSICTQLKEWAGGEDELYLSTEKVKSVAEEFNAVQIGYDCIGVGAGVGSNLNNMGWEKHFKFNAAGAVKNQQDEYKEGRKNGEHFLNVKAQAWQLVADRFKNTYLAIEKGKAFAPDELISISSECDSKLVKQLIEELCAPRKEFVTGGKLKVEGKKELKKRDIKSPNIADSLIIAACPNLAEKAEEVRLRIL